MALASSEGHGERVIANVSVLEKMNCTCLIWNVVVLSQDNIKTISYATKHKHVHNYFSFQLYKLGGTQNKLESFP